MASLRRFVPIRSGVAASATAAEFIRDNADELRGQDNAGLRATVQRPTWSLGQHLGIGLLGKDTYPIVKAQDIGGGFGSKGGVAARTSPWPPRPSISAAP